MMMETVLVELPGRSSRYEIKVGSGLLRQIGAEIRTALGSPPRRIGLISTRTVFSLFGRQVVRGLRASEFEVHHWLMKEGERHKTLASLEGALKFVNQSRLERSDVVVALGGGVVGDLAGFAAATYLRGIDLIQVPTTLLAQIDSSVGGKTGVNLAAGKNLVGAFHQPRLVVIDVDTLRSLPRRELTSGWCEAVKQGAVGDRGLLDRTVRLLRNIDFKLWPKRSGRPREKSASQTEVYAAELAAVIAANCRFKASIVAGDERESIERTDRNSRRILNFGHTTAHALEAVTRYRRFRHGEAVGYGMLVAGELSKNLGTLAASELELLRDAVSACGPLPRTSDIDLPAVMRAMKGDKKSVGGNIKWVLLEKIGQSRIVDSSHIDSLTLRAALREGLRAKS